MPTKTERLAHLVSRLRSRRAPGSTLVVQTGFPTSLADLVVKNQAKFRRKKKPSLSDRAPDRYPVSSAGNPPPLVAAFPHRMEMGEEEAPPRPPRRRRGVGLGLGFLVVKAAALAVLATGRKWIVAGITILTFGLLVLELTGFWRRQRSSDGSVFNLGGRGLVSPIRVVADCSESRNNVSLPERRDFDGFVDDSKDQNLLLEPISNKRNGLELISPIREFESEDHHQQNSRRISDILLENRCTSEQIECNVDNREDLGSSRKSKRKKLFRKFFKRKNREKREKEKESSSLDGSRISDQVVVIEDEEEEEEEGAEINDEEYFSFEDCHEVVQIGAESVNVIREKSFEVEFGRWKKLVFFIIVLLGLLGGKGFALVMTVAWYLLSVCTGTVWKKWKMQRID